MGYATGAATGVSDLLSAIQAFALAEGWTIDSGKAVRSDNATNPGECINISKGDIHAAVYSLTTAGATQDPGYFVGVQTYPAYSSGLGNVAQADMSPQIYTNKMGQSGFVAHHLFGGPNHIHVIVEVTSGTFKYFGIGQVDKLGAVTDGVYAYSSRMNYVYLTNLFDGNHSFPFDYMTSPMIGLGTVVRADADGVSPRYSHTRAYSAAGQTLICGGRSSSSPLYLPFAQTEVSEQTGRMILYPIMMSVERGSGFYSPIGYVPDVRMCKITNYNPGDSLVIAGDTWRLFPWIRKNGALGEETSLNYGYAYLQRP